MKHEVQSYLSQDFDYYLSGNCHEILQVIPRLSDSELIRLERLARSHVYFRNPSSNTHLLRVLDSVAAIQSTRREESKREQLRDALIEFLQSNTHLGNSMTQAAETIAQAVESSGRMLSGSADEIVQLLQDIRIDVASSDLPALISEVRRAVARRRR